MSDIRFVGEDVHIEGNVQRVTCFDIELDNAGRRSHNRGRRRAFVHDFQDGLTLNWDRDYPGGVTLNGDVKMPHGSTVATLNGTVLRCTHHTLQLDHAAHRPLPVLTQRAAGKRRPRSPPRHPRHPQRRWPACSAAVVNRSGQRRALMHDSGDGLTVNVDRDYPGG